MKKEYEILIKKAQEAMKLSYSPYSKFKVGAAILTDDNKIFLGANIENASYGLSMCGERNAVYNAYLNGYNKENIKALVIIGDTNNPISPCGACRQVLHELLSKDCEIILTNLKGDIKITNVDELLPYSFNSEDLI